MEYENLSLNIGGGSAVAGSANTNVNANEAEQQPNMCGGQEVLEVKAKEKARRYWSPSEEERLYEIWGRENWRLTRNGKNTIFFAQWSEELHERYAVDVKPEEIQMKVNQTRAKFRQVKKQLQNDPATFPTRWKKYDMINRILKNLHRPKNAEPIPPEVLLNNRDVSPIREEDLQQQTQHEPQRQQQPQAQAHAIRIVNVEPSSNQFYSNNNSNSNNSSSNNNNNNNSTLNFSTELFTDQYDEVKQEYDDEDYRSLPFQEQIQQYSPAESAQLLELQTPLQQQQQQQQQIQQPQHQQYQSEYTQQSYAGAPATAYHNNTNNGGTSTNSNSNNVVASSSINPQAITAVAYINSSNNTISVATSNTNSNGSMQPPVATAVSNSNTGAASGSSTPIPTPRKRGRPFGSAALQSDSLEALFMDEMRRKNQLLAEQTKIARQRLELEERKVDLLQMFLPKCLEQQNNIVARIMQLPQMQQPSIPPQQ
ncbi:CG7239 [Drosophila busckii]|uniref:CG7239 n=1 Tax=Drosophila busckii TaxID=30019 RepID=A0A0M3QTZ2_DROBS|nr:putative uncharacterized protein DDB_G0271606 [Drosophila busckii]ALC39729.1 CG7239 [Drosophila busckii]